VVPDFVEEVLIQEEKYPTMLFVGDVMLGRHVESLMEENGIEFPFKNVALVLETPDVTVGNFEGIVSEEHVHSPSMTFQFSIQPDYLRQLHEKGFDVLSLANNHSFDYGLPALLHTRSLCILYSLVCGGTPAELDEYSTQILQVGSKKVGIIFIHTVFKQPDVDTLKKLIEKLNQESDVQFSFVHWGVEYDLIHSTTQEDLAKIMIDQGIDAVIGHHPHVVQDIGFYKNKPIFYSLGNFIFDQYFSNDVQEGLGVSLRFKKDSIEYVLVPFTSKETRSQPKMMEGIEKTALLSRILGSYSGLPFIDTENGIIKVQDNE
jgi:poly-gamma-glutamate synthesis protein (capsule biosynthesis protein)